MTRRIVAVALVALLSLSGAWAVKAQDTPTPVTGSTGTVIFAVGDNEFDLDPRAPISLCVVGVNETIDDAYVTVQVFARTIDANQFEPLGVIQTRALGDGLKLGTCIALRIDE